MKNINQFINEYIVKKKLDTPIDSEYKYHPKSKDELIENIKELISKDIYDFNCIDTSKITDMSNLFYNSKFENINIDVSNWNVHNVKNMKGMFFEYNSFNCDLSGWDVSNVTDMSFMFDSCKNFNCNLSKWNVSNVENMSCMFNGCEKFKAEGLNKWNVNKVKDKEMMFYGCIALKNKPSWYRE